MMEKKLKQVKSVTGVLKETEEKVTEQSFTKDGITRSIRVREVENGFIVEIVEDGYIKNKSGDSNWHHVRQTWISKVNPLLDSDDEDGIELASSTQDTIKAALASLKL